MNILIGKLGKSIKFKKLKINTGDDSCMILFSTMARMLPEHNFYFCGSNDFDKLTDEERNYLFPNNNVFSLKVKPDIITKKSTEEHRRAVMENHIDFSHSEPTYDDFVSDGSDIVCWDTLYKSTIDLGIKFDFALMFTGYVGNRCLDLAFRKDGKGSPYFKTMNAFKRYVGPYVYMLNALNVPLYTIVEDPRYVTINTLELFNRERLVLTQMADCEVPIKQKYITSYDDTTFNHNVPVKCTYAGVEKIFLMGIDKNWKDKIDIDKKLNNTELPKCIVISNGHGTTSLNSGLAVDDGRLPGYKEYIIDGLANTEYADTHIYGLWSDEVLNKYPYTIQNKSMVDLDNEIAAAKYSFVYSIVPNFITIKPYEMIIKGLLPFIHPDYDKNRLLNIPEYLYVSSPADLVTKMKELDKNPEMYKRLLNECFDAIKPEYLDGSYLVNNIMSKIGNNLGFDYINHKGVPSIFDHFAKDIFDNTKISK